MLIGIIVNILTMDIDKRTSPPPKGDFPKYTSKILKATAQLDDTKTLLSYWDEDLSIEDNFAKIRDLNLLGKSSRSRVEDELRIFRQRYFFDDDVSSALSYFVKNNLSSEVLHPILFYFSAKADTLLYDTTTDILDSFTKQGRKFITVDETKQEIQKFVDDGKTTTRWSESTILRVSRHLLATLRDFGMLDGEKKKKISSIYLPNEAFVFIALFLYNNGNPGVKLVNHPDWRLFFMDPRMVERFLIECHQQGLLNYHGAGSVIRIDFPTTSLTEYADVLTRK